METAEVLTKEYSELKAVLCILRKKKKNNHRSRQPRREWASALRGAGVEGQHRATPTRAAAPEAPPYGSRPRHCAPWACWLGLRGALVGNIGLVHVSQQYSTWCC